MRIKINLLIYLCMSTATLAQKFTHEASIPTVSSKGFYKVRLSPELIGKLNVQKSDLRIHDKNGQEQPYFLFQERPSSSTSLYKEYKILERKKQSGYTTQLTFHNPNRLSIDNVSITVKNTDVRKRARLTGSNDRKNWYVIKNNYLLHAMHSTNATAELKILNFPLSDYEFFKLELLDKKTLPINILSIGYYDIERVKGVSSFCSFQVVQQKDSLKTSYIRLEAAEKAYLEKLSLEVSGAEYYSREGAIFAEKEVLTKKKEKKKVFQKVQSFELNSNSINEVELRGIATKEIRIEIYNGDNQPLKVTKATGSMLNTYAIVEMSPSTDYAFKLGNTELATPAYDIGQFQEEILPKATLMDHNIVLLSKKEDKASSKTFGLFDSPYAIWTVIIAVGLVLGFVSFKMIREMK